MEFLRKTTQLRSPTQQLGLHLTARLVFDNPTHGELADFFEAEGNGKLKEKIQENYDKKIAALTDRIKSLETEGKSADDIKKTIQKEKSKLLQEAINQSLKDLKIQRKVNGKLEPISYMQLTNHPDKAIKDKIDGIYNAFDAKISDDISKAVDTYMSQKGAATAKATEGLKAGLKPFDASATNSETAKLQDMLDARKGVIAKSKGELAELKIDRSEAYRARTSMADIMTAPKGGIIDNYETDLKFWSREVTNEKNPTRYRLQGFLYANDIFAGGGEAGQAAMNEAIKEPRKLYVDHWPDKLTQSDLESGMGMKSYFEAAQKYSNFDRVIGTIAGLLRLADKNIANPDQLKRYKEHLNEKFADLNAPERKQNEEKSLQYLYSIQSFSEFIGADPNWRAEFNRIDNLTDPDAPGAKIDDYPGTGKDNKFNKTRWQLNGYLFSVYLFNGKSKVATNNEFERAAKMFKDSGLIDKDFTQDMIEKDKKGKNDGFGLKEYLDKAENYTKDDEVKGIIAGLLKQADDLSGTKKTTYQVYLDTKFKTLSPGDSPESQKTVLATISSPDEAEKELKNDLFSGIIEDAIAASKQHNQITLEKKFKESFGKDPQTMSMADLDKLATDVKGELDKFVKERSETARKAMQSKYDAIIASNAKLPKPLYDADTLNPLAKSIEDNALEFSKAQAIQKEGNLHKSIEDKYLEKLTTAEKNYFNIVEQLDAKQKAIADQAAAKAPDQNKPLPDNGGGSPNVGPVGPGGSPETPAEGDPYLADWPNAPRVTPDFKDYTGSLIADAAASNDKIVARDNDGKKVREVPNGTEFNRTPEDAKELARRVQYLNFIRVTAKDGKKVWLPEQMLYRREDYDVPSAAPKTVDYDINTTAPLAEAASKLAEKPKYGATYWDIIFSRVGQEVETSSVGSTFDFLYNGQSIGCRAQKLPDGYHLSFLSQEAGQGDLVFRSMQEIRNYCETGRFYQRLAMQTILDRNNWDRFKDENWLDDLTEDPKRTGDWTASIELDWKRNNAFETGNGKIDLAVGPDGRINYTIHKDHVGPSGENERTGFASDFTQLVQALNHAKNWSENYEGVQSAPEFPAVLEHEKALSALMDARTFENLRSQIGEKYFFGNFYNFGYSFMYLNWDQEGELFARNRSLKNPILELKLGPNNSISWKLVNRTGANSAWVGVTGTARDITDLAYQVENVKKDPAKAMITPAENLPNLGNLGYNLY